MVPIPKGDERGDVDARRGGPRDEGLEPLAPLDEGQRPEIGVAVLQQVVGADEGRMAADQLGGDGLAVEALLQVAERRDGDAPLLLAATRSSPSMAPSK